jgi:gamma-glutamylcyclotransferase (GGCT)/AIG2-like uncharacterized protein YtfP
MEYLFIYGTLLVKVKNAMSDFLQSHAEFIGQGFFHGKLYNTGEYPGAVLSSNGVDKVYGMVCLLNDAEKVFTVLDVYEEVGRQYPEPNEYIRQKITVFLHSQKELTCWVYLYNRPVDDLEQILSGDYLKIKESEGK